MFCSFLVYRPLGDCNRNFEPAAAQLNCRSRRPLQRCKSSSGHFPKIMRAVPKPMAGTAAPPLGGTQTRYLRCEPRPKPAISSGICAARGIHHLSGTQRHDLSVFPRPEPRHFSALAAVGHQPAFKSRRSELRLKPPTLAPRPISENSIR